MTRSILITGSTTGIGRSAAETLAQQGWHVILHGRTEAKGRTVLDDLRQRVPQARFDLVTGDLADLVAVGALADQVKALTASLDVLWNNAGMFVTESKASPQGFELQWAVNYLAVVRLTQRLLPLVQAAPQGRILLTNSFAHHAGRLTTGPEVFRTSSGRYNGWTTYGSTKLAGLLYTKELARRLGPGPVTVHAYHPGYVRTTIGSNGDPRQGNSASWLSLFQVPVEKGAETGVYLATDAQPGITTGLYWSSKRVRRGSRKATAEAAQRLWTLTEEALGP